MTNIKTLGETLASISDKVDLEVQLTNKAIEEAKTKFAAMRERTNKNYSDLFTLLKDDQKNLLEELSVFEKSTIDEFEARASALVEIIAGPTEKE